MESLAGSKRIKRCASCGSTALGGRTSNLSGEVFLCVGCTVRMRSGAGLDYRLPTKDDSPLPIQERFTELFAAARALLRKDAEENQVIPTLALANEIGQGRPHLIAEKERLLKLGDDKEAWDEEASKFARRYGGLRPIWTAKAPLILEKMPLSVDIDYDVSDQNPKGVMVNVYPHRTLAQPEDVAAAYGEKLSDAGISCNEQRTGRLSFAFRNGVLVIDVEPGVAVEHVREPKPGWRIDKASFPHPRLLGDFYKMLKDRFAGDLATRRRGPTPETENLVPACVAFLLRTYGLEGRMEIHRILNEHVLSEIGEELQLGTTDTATYKLWRTVGNNSLVGGPLLDAAWTLFYEGYEYE